MMKKPLLCMGLTLSLLAAGAANAAPIALNSDPFAGSTALTTPGRQIVGGEPFISFDTTVDQFVIDSAFFSVTAPVNFNNAFAASLTSAGLNVIVLRDLDNDANSATAFNAGSAANLIADQLVSDGAGFFVYFNSGLNLPRLVYSTNLNDNTADLKIMARMTNLVGSPAALSSFSQSNFHIIAAPEPQSWTLMLGAVVGLAAVAMNRRGRSTARVWTS